MVRSQGKTSLTSSGAEKGAVAHLYLNGVHVGAVTVKGFNASWGFGEFAPGPAFGEFAPMYGQWALLMQMKAERRDRARSAELQQIERVLDSIHAHLYFPDDQRWVAIPQVAISDNLLEWKEY